MQGFLLSHSEPVAVRNSVSGFDFTSSIHRTKAKLYQSLPVRLQAEQSLDCLIRCDRV